MKEETDLTRSRASKNDDESEFKGGIGSDEEYDHEVSREYDDVPNYEVSRWELFRAQLQSEWREVSRDLRSERRELLRALRSEP